MTYEKTIKRLEGRIRILENHIKMAKEGKIQEDCISCREQDLIEFKAELRYLKGLKQANELLKKANVSFKKKMLEQYEILRILKEYADTSVERSEFIDGEEHEYTAIVIELPNDGGSDYEAIKEWLEENE